MCVGAGLEAFLCCADRSTNGLWHFAYLNDAWREQHALKRAGVNDEDATSSLFHREAARVLDTVRSEHSVVRACALQSTHALQCVAPP